MGIKAEDLRRGNLLNFDSRIVKVSVIGSDYLGVKDGHKISSLDYSWLKPIPLTEEWLIKFGFEYEDLYDDPPYEWHKKNGIEIWNFNKSHWICDALDQSNIDQRHFKYVHQLQNLYYALTNTELTIK